MFPAQTQQNIKIYHAASSMVWGLLAGTVHAGWIQLAGNFKQGEHNVLS